MSSLLMKPIQNMISKEQLSLALKWCTILYAKDVMWGQDIWCLGLDPRLGKTRPSYNGKGHVFA